MPVEFSLEARRIFARAPSVLDPLAQCHEELLEIGTTSTRRDELARDEARLDAEAQSLQDKAVAVEARMYSGEVASPKELQAMQADVEQLRRHQRNVENSELELMEQREPFDAELAELAATEQQVSAGNAELRSALAAAETEIEAELAVERQARSEIASSMDPKLVLAYEQARIHSQGAGAARLVGHTCQGCHLSIPATEVERIKRAPDGSISHCDNCGCILVP